MVKKQKSNNEFKKYDKCFQHDDKQFQYAVTVALNHENNVLYAPKSSDYIRHTYISKHNSRSKNGMNFLMITMAKNSIILL